jgi:hypothetical protein
MIKAPGIAFLIVGILGVQVYADCPYFRVSAKLLECKVMDPSLVKSSDTVAPPSDTPELEEAPSTQKLVEVNCSCDYNLSGSDPRCDGDQSFERSSVVGNDDSPTFCRRGNALCRDICPSRLP